jgi:hypothetical protein
MAGLMAGLAIGILILLWLEDERSFDSFQWRYGYYNISRVILIP